MRSSSLILLLLAALRVPAQVLPPVSPHIHVDQLGYRPSAQKVAVISDPQAGFNAAESFSPGGTYEVRRTADQMAVFSGAITPWNAGAVHTQSGDRAWWFDFSALQTAGEYYVFDPANNVASYPFAVGPAVYVDALRAAQRALFYQRCGMAKSAAHGGVWNDGACHTHALQDLECRAAASPNDASTGKDLSGGWHDAGDYNKYVNFTYSPLHDLLFAYQENSAAFTDANNLPESGNGMPDLLDEVKYELDWLLKMQLADGSVLMKVAVPCFEAVSPPSADLTQRLYGPAQASATRVACSIFAHAAVVYAALGQPAATAFADSLRARAVLAWNWLQANPAPSAYDNAGFCSANPELDATTQDEVLTGAAALLFAATGQTAYQAYFDAHYSAVRPYQWTYWYPFQSTIQNILLYYTGLPGATAAVAADIRQNCTTSVDTNNPDLLPAWLDGVDAYRAYLKNDDYVWGSNQFKCNAASILYGMVVHDLSPANHPHYTNAAEGFVHFLHGVNPINQLMLSNFAAYGGEKSCQEIYHSWFADGTVFDNATTSTGPAPGFLPGGFNPNYSPAPECGCTIAPPQNNPHQKAFKDWNTSWPENSWEVTEPAIYTQAAYIKLLSKFVGADPTTAAPVAASGHRMTLGAYPNPTSGIVDVRISGGVIDRATPLRLRTAAGAVVLEKTIGPCTTGATVRLELSALPAGLYFLEMPGAAPLGVVRN